MSKALPGLKKSQLKAACSALLKHIEDTHTKQDLLEEDELILMTIALTRIPTGQRKDKPIRLSLPTPLHNAMDAEICLFAKDYKGEGHKEAKQRWRHQEKAGIKKVIGISKLKTKYEAPEAKRQLASAFDIFLADERILPSLPKLIGKSFFKRKRQPIPMDCTKTNWKAQVETALQSTYMFQPAGNTVSIKIGKSSFTAEECALNAYQVLKQAVEHLPKKWRGVRGVYVKTPDSLALPVFQRLPGDASLEEEADANENPSSEAVKDLPTTKSSTATKKIALGKAKGVKTLKKRKKPAQQ